MRLNKFIPTAALALLFALGGTGCEERAGERAEPADTPKYSVMFSKDSFQLSDKGLAEIKAAAERGERGPLPPEDPTLPNDPIEGWPPPGSGTLGALQCMQESGRTNGQCSFEYDCGEGRCALSCVTVFDEETGKCSEAAICAPCPVSNPTGAPTQEPSEPVPTQDPDYMP